MSLTVPKSGDHISSEGIPSCKLSLILPTLNEAANLERMVKTLEKILTESGNLDFEIIVVDDNSPDGTGRIADRLAVESNGTVRVIHRYGPAGLGFAAVDGWLSAKGRVLAIMDADFQHPPELIPRLLKTIDDGADIAIASRYISGGAIPRWSLHRRLLSHLGTAVTRLALGEAAESVTDPLSGCFAMRRDVIAGIILYPAGFKILLEVLGHGSYQTVREVPYRFASRDAGKSKMRLNMAFHDARLLLRLAWEIRLSRKQR